MAKVKIFSIYFYDTPRYESESIVPIQAGRPVTGINLGMLSDDTGDNISAKNLHYGEMTAWYWVWKNILPADPGLTHVGFCHYRRYLDFTGSDPATARKRMTYAKFRKFFAKHYSQKEILDAIGDADIATRPYRRHTKSLLNTFLAGHPELEKEFGVFKSIMLKQFPTYRELIESEIASKYQNFELQFVMKRNVFEEFMKWAFKSCEELEKRCDLSIYTETGPARAPAFLLERFFGVWLKIMCVEKGWKTKEFHMFKLDKRPWYWGILNVFSHFTSPKRRAEFKKRYVK